MASNAAHLGRSRRTPSLLGFFLLPPSLCLGFLRYHTLPLCLRSRRCSVTRSL
jgi:hypothetical protein